MGELYYHRSQERRDSPLKEGHPSNLGVRGELLYRQIQGIGDSTLQVEDSSHLGMWGNSYTATARVDGIRPSRQEIPHS